jgi:hypothetical protein
VAETRQRTTSDDARHRTEMQAMKGAFESLEHSKQAIERTAASLIAAWFPLTSAPKDATEILALIDLNGELTTKVIHHAQDLSGEEQPPFSGWFYEVKDGAHRYFNYVRGEIVGWLPVDVKRFAALSATNEAKAEASNA